MKALYSPKRRYRVSVFPVLCAVWALCCVALALPGEAGADSNRVAKASGPSTARTIEITMPTEYHGIRLAPGGVVTIALESPVAEVVYRKDWKVTVTPTPDGVRLTAPKNVRPDELRGLILLRARHFTLHGIVDPGSEKHLIVRDSKGNVMPKADSAIVVTHKSQMDVIREAIKARVQVITMELKTEEAAARKALEEKHAAELEALREEKEQEKEAMREEYEARIEKLEADQHRYAETSVARAIHTGHSSQPVKLGDCESPGLFICGLRWGKTGENGLLRVVIDNRSHQEITIASVAVHDELGLEDRSGGLYIEGQETRRDGTMLVKIPPLTRVEGSLIVHDPKSVGQTLRVMAMSPTGVVHASQWIELQRPAQPEREKALGVNGALGVIWLKDGLGGERRETTDLAGLGIWALYAFSERWHLELDALGASTGDVRFAGTTIDGTRGELTRSATLLRIRTSALARLGTEGLMPYLRLGAGVQATSYTEEFSAGEVPDSSIDADFIFGVGGGVQIRLGELFIVGAELGFTEKLSGASRHVQAGVHFGYTWQPVE